MVKKRIRIGTVLKRTYSKTKRNITKNAKKSATLRAINNTGKRIKNRLFKIVKKTSQSVKRMTHKADVSVAKKIRSVTKRRH
jgi:hypothetical protein